MQTVFTEPFVSRRPPPRRPAPPGAVQPASVAEAVDRDLQFLSMLAAFRSSGGIDRAAQVEKWLEANASANVGASVGANTGALARWMAHKDVIHFDWQLHTWLPMFQFAVATRVPLVAVGLVLIEFDGRFDHWDIARWFARPSPALGGRTPAEVLTSDPALVIDAARQEKCWLGHSSEVVHPGHAAHAGP